MPSRTLRVALVGGVPASLGAGGLELQMERTASALRRRGHDVFHTAHEPEPRPFDVLHAFSSEPDVWHALSHWRRNPAPLVVSAVTVAAAGAERHLLLAAARLPLRSLAPRMRAEVVARADAAVALTEDEAALLRRLGARRVEIIGNGVDRVDADPSPALPEDAALLLGTVSRRKRQAETVRAFAAAQAGPVVVAGGWDGPLDERDRFAAAVESTGGRWLGEVPPPTARALVRRSRALVHLSSAEGQSLAVLEALAEGTPVIAAPLPANRALAAAYPGWVILADDDDAAARAFATLQPPSGPPPAVPTWDDVAERLERLYLELVTAS